MVSVNIHHAAGEGDCGFPNLEKVPSNNILDKNIFAFFSVRLTP